MTPMNSEAATARVPCRPSQASAAAGAARGDIQKLRRAGGVVARAAYQPCHHPSIAGRATRYVDCLDADGSEGFMARTDAIVLGAGIVGTSVALQLAKKGLAVALVDRRGPGEETS